MTPPRELQNRLREGKVIPFVGAGVSMAVRDLSGKPLFPSWRELLIRAAQKLEDEKDPKRLAPVVRSLMDADEPEYLLAAERARKGLGANWHTFLKAQMAHSFENVDPESISLARKVWSLGSRLVITTNYDKVLRWACPSQNDSSSWDIESRAEQIEALRGNIPWPTVWHLHGHIDNVNKIILTPDGYNKLYPEGDIQPLYEAALKTLQTLLLRNSFLFIGYSLDDHHLGLQLKGLVELFGIDSGVHYALIRKDDVDRVRNLRLPVEILTFADHGAPLLSYLDMLSTIAVEGAAERSSTHAPPKFRLRIYHSPTEEAVVEQMRSQLSALSLDLSLETHSPLSAETIAQDKVADADAVIVCLSSTAVTDNNFSELINVALQSVPDESLNLNHLIAVNAEDATDLDDIGHYPTIRLFTEAGYQQLLKAVALAANSGLRHRARSNNGESSRRHNDLQILRFWTRVSLYKPIALIFPDTPPEGTTSRIEMSRNDFTSGMVVFSQLQSLFAIDESVIWSHSTEPQIDECIKNHCCVYIAGRVRNPKARELFERIQHRLVYKFDRTSTTTQGWIASDDQRYDSDLEEDEIRLDYGLITAAWRLPADFCPSSFLWAAGSTGFGTQAAAKATISPTTVTEILSRLDPKAGGFQVLVSTAPKVNEFQVLFDTLVPIDLSNI